MPAAEARPQPQPQPDSAAAPPGVVPESEPDLADRVQWTCRGACALRAIELLRRAPAPIVSDPLALAMAGRAALARFGALYDAWERDYGPGGHSYFAGRARVVDAMVSEAAAELARASEAAVQVVSIGAGMDTRPWRLSLPPGTAWFDVDQAPVLALKAKLLRGARAQLPAGSATGGGESSRSGDGGGGDDGGGSGSGGGGGSDGGGGYTGPFPLKCASYRQVVADLEEAGLAGSLAAAGFDASAPTVWVAEGVCYYLSLAANAALLRDAAACSPRGSRLIATHVPRCNLEANQTTKIDSPIARLFTVCVEDVLSAGLPEAAGWRGVARSEDFGDMVAARCGGARAYYPYGLEYSGGRKLPAIECVVTAERA
ncbi:hypothetical protein Rsub_08535 [Raphidocelis subcapitata]|uniref:S-adenosyl-L-methionine-dependent methyltransferase n=1 Tax=Raphidocelis subcapitata TaxID=307507 RepID=A0A2V0P6Q7_9CHLO|nr:hypothetical protein Rsub_08535 [Raphidocelis subcapitata]|eukprot:GBF95554.1 hypothetical protein Rsub_08535 [Raphidocelis subcapitata]